MRVVIVSKILVVAAYRKKLEALASHPEIDELIAITGPEWREPGGRRVRFEKGDTPENYQMRVEPIWLNGSYHLFVWPRLGRALREIRPDLVHIDEEPYNLATAHGTWHARRVGARSLFFAWQNLLRRYPPPFNWFERNVYAHSALAIAGSQDALNVLRAKGYCGPGAVIPQFGVDPSLFSPATSAPSGTPVIGFIARLVEEKGIFVLLDALHHLRGDWRLHVVGTGPAESMARQLASDLGIGHRVRWENGVPSMDVPSRLQSFTVLVQPSLTRQHWKEQFGRTVMEAMACGVPVIGSDSAEIPNVLGGAGVVVAEGNANALREAIARVLADEDLRCELARRGRQRVLECYTHARIAEHTVAAYRAATMN